MSMLDLPLSRARLCCSSDAGEIGPAADAVPCCSRTTMALGSRSTSWHNVDWSKQEACAFPQMVMLWPQEKLWQDTCRNISVSQSNSRY